MNDIMLIAALSSYYSQLERRLENAANPRDPEVRRAIAEAAFDLLIASCTPALQAELQPRRADSVATMIAQRDAIADSVHAVGRRLPRPVFTGPINVGFGVGRRVNMVMLSQPGLVDTYAQSVRNAVHGSVPMLDLAKTTWADLENRNGLFYGTPSGHKFIADALAESGWEVTKDFISLGGRKFEGENLVLIVCRARPKDVTLCDIIYTGHDENAIVGINLLHHGPSDFVIGRQAKPNKYQILTRGNFAKGPRGEPLTKLT